MKKYYFPLNYDYLGKIFGIIDYKLILPLTFLGISLFLILSFFNISIFIKIGIFTTIFLPIFLIFNTSINHEPFYLFAISIVKHYSNSNKYIIK